jgi:hypothetical protein
VDTIACETVIGDPRTTTVTVATTTVYTTRVSTLRRIFRNTSFTTTTVTSTVRLTKTDLSISARTLTSDIYFTQPSFVLLTRYFYVDSTSVTTTTAPTYVATFTEMDTIVLNSIVRTTTSTTTTESTFLTLNTFFQTDQATFDFTFTDPSNVVITEAPSTNFFTITLFVRYTTTSFPTNVVFEFTTSVYVSSVVSTSQSIPVVYINPTTISVSDTLPMISFAPTATRTFLIQ